MNPITIDNWTHDPARRKRRFRCGSCSKLIEDGSNVVIERRPGGAHGYHADCFDADTWNREAVLARAAKETER